MKAGGHGIPGTWRVGYPVGSGGTEGEIGPVEATHHGAEHPDCTLTQTTEWDTNDSTLKMPTPLEPVQGI